ncbi:unnamed protein product [Rotaria sordida]|uniref:Uncharacterized protein n=1 Tax=Rotaria sordida TaxID=392033 RepID=A0A815GQP8_9BILA|nr:unnamed protein product [Rotaria sordida]
MTITSALFQPIVDKSKFDSVRTHLSSDECSQLKPDVVHLSLLFAKTLLDKCKCYFNGKTDSYFSDIMYKILHIITSIINYQQQKNNFF